MSAPDAVLKLVERFRRNRDDYRGGRYKEAQVRNEFIDPLFIALGWDVHNTAGYAEAYKDVIHEDAIKEGAPDYCFRVGGRRMFFLEAKKPSVDIAADVGPSWHSGATDLRVHYTPTRIALGVRGGNRYAP